MSRAKYLVVFATMVLAAFVIALMMRSHSDEKVELRIGVIAPLSGNAGAYGEWVRNGLQMAKSDLNGAHFPIELVFEDDKGDPKTAVTGFYRLRDVERVDAIVCALTPSTLAIKPLASEAAIPVITPVASHPDVTKGSDVVFRNALNSRREAEAIATHVLSHKLAKRVAVLYINDAGGIASKDAVLEAMGTISGTAFPFEKGTLDFSTTVAAALASEGDADAFYVTGYGREMGAVIRDLRARGFTGQILANQGIENAEVLRIAGNAANGILFTFYSPPKSIPPALAGENASSPATLAAYEALQVLHQAFELARSSQKSIPEILHQESFTGIFGTVEFDSNGDTKRPISIKRIDAGRTASFVEEVQLP